MDRIDLHIEVTPVPFEALSRRDDAEPSAAVRRRVVAARQRQAERFDDVEGRYCNAQLTSPEVRRWCRLDEAGRGLLKSALTRLGLSARAHDRILKVARTIADLDGREAVEPAHVAEAIQYRSLDRAGWGLAG